MMLDNEWQPRVLGLLCKWCSYSAADLAGTRHRKYPANIYIIQVPCSSWVDPLFILKALRMGFDGVLVSGCHPGDCHYQTGNYRARRRMSLTGKFLENLGVDPRRVKMSWISATEDYKFVEVVNEMVADLKDLGPNSMFADNGPRDAVET